MVEVVLKKGYISSVSDFWSKLKQSNDLLAAILSELKVSLFSMSTKYRYLDFPTVIVSRIFISRKSLEKQYSKKSNQLSNLFT